MKTVIIMMRNKKHQVASIKKIDKQQPSWSTTISNKRRLTVSVIQKQVNINKLSKKTQKKFFSLEMP